MGKNKLSIEKQSSASENACKLFSEKVFPNPSDIETIKDKIEIDDNTELEAYRIIPAKSKTSKTLFYIPGTASSVYYLDIIELIGRNLAKELNTNVIVIINRLTQQNKFPLPYNDLSRGINYYMEKNEKYQIDLNQLTLGGYSSGAFLAILICMTNSRYKKKPFRQLLLISPVVDMGTNPVPDEHKDSDFMTPDFFDEMVNNFFPQNYRKTWSIVSPLKARGQLFKLFPSVILIYGSDECMAKNNQEFVEKLCKQQVNITVVILKDKKHNFPWHEIDYIKQIADKYRCNDNANSSDDFSDNLENKLLKTINSQNYYRCPITNLIMRDPVYVSEKEEIYEKESAQKKFPNMSFSQPSITQSQINVLIESEPNLLIENEVYLPVSMFKQFYKAVLEGDVEKVKALLKGDIRLLIQSQEESVSMGVTCCLNEENEESYKLTGFQLICERGGLELLKAIAGFMQKNWAGEYDIIKRVLDHNKADNYNPVVLNQALIDSIAQNGDNLDFFVEQLVAWGADVNTIANTDHAGQSPLHLATMYAKDKIVTFLLNKNANVEARNKHGETPWLVINSFEVAKLLINGKVDVKATINTKNEYEGWNIFHILTKKGGKHELVEKLLKEFQQLRPLLKQRSIKYDEQPIYIAADTVKDMKMTKIMMKYGANIRGRNSNGYFAMGAPGLHTNGKWKPYAKTCDELLGEQAATALRKARKLTVENQQLKNDCTLIKQALDEATAEREHALKRVVNLEERLNKLESTVNQGMTDQQYPSQHGAN